MFDSIAVIVFYDNNPGVELRHLRYFAAVARHLNYSEAARRLHVAQPAVSQTVLDLEEELGVALFLRNKRQVQLTAAGTTFLREAEEILRRSVEAGRLALRASRGEVGELRVGFMGSATAPLLPGLVRAYRRNFPNVEIHLYEMTPDQQLAAFDRDEIDLGFTRPLPPGRTNEFAEEMVYVDRLQIALPVGHDFARAKRVRLKLLAGESFIQFHRNGAPGLFDTVIRVCQEAGFSPRVVDEPTQMATVMTLVESDLGVSLVPACVRNLRHTGAVLRPIDSEAPEIPLCAVWRKPEPHPAREAFIALLMAERTAIRQAMEPGRDEP